MLSKEGFQFHLSSVEHHAGWLEYNKDEQELAEVSQQSIDRSKQVLIKNFQEQEKEIQQLNTKLKEIKDICTLYTERGWALNPDKIEQIIEKSSER